jgi:CRISPR-associated protein Cmr2
VITIGGDDVLILIPARAALDFAVSLVEHFRIAGQADGLTLSAGIAIGQPSTPIRILLDVARQALKNAKRRRQETPLPAIDFHHLVKEGYFANSLPKFRDDNEALYQGRTVSAYLTGRPYTITEAQLLLSSLKAVQNGDFPNSQLHAIVRELRRSELRGSVFYSYQLARMDEAEARVMQDIKQAWSAVTDVEEYPWLTLPARSEKSHIFADLVNLL